MIHGAPGETAEDVHASAEFLEQHKHLIDRVSMNRFQIMMGPSFLRRFDERPSRVPAIKVNDRHPRMAIVDHQMTSAHSLKYFTATQRLMQIVHNINRKTLPKEASVFAGVM